MSKIILNFIMSVSILFMTVLLVIAVYPAGAVNAAGILEQIHAGTAWEAYKSGNLAEAERQFQLLIDREKNREPDTNTTVKSEELMNLELGLAYTRTKLAGLISSKEINSSSNAMPASSKKLLISSKELFADLIRRKYKLTDCVPAILGILSQLKDYKTMDEYLPMLKSLFSGQELDKWNYLFAESAWAAYNAKNYQVAQKKFETLLQKQIIQKNLNGTINPDNRTINPDAANWVTGLGYTLYQQEKYDAAYDLLNDLTQKQNIKSTPEITELKLMVCRKLADPLTSKLKKGKYGVLNGYDNIFYQRHKNGDDGTSRLDESVVSVSFNNPNTISYNNIVSTYFDLLFKSRYLSNGKNGGADGTTNNYAKTIGTFYRSLNGQESRQISSNSNVITHQTFVRFETWKSFIPLKLEIITGISPVGGAVDPTPLFNVTAVKNDWKAEIHRSGVDDSILSISGLEDPYSDAHSIHSQEWGRVVKNGMTLGNNFSFGKNNWFSINGEFNAYRGLNVWQNSSYQLNAASGKTIAMQNGDQITFGVYTTWMHFEHNSNFYTFGHGGYYSPDLMLTAGPLFRYKTESCRDYFIDAQISAGLMVEDNEDAPKYPIHYEIVDEFTKNAFDELNGIYKGKSSTRMTGSIKVESWKLMTDHLAAGGFCSMNATSEDLEWRIGVGIEYYFDARSAFFHRQDAGIRLNHF